jgi:hypothetical protein
VTLDEAKRRLAEAAQRLMQGDEAAQADFDKWDRVISTHPQFIAEVRGPHVWVYRRGHAGLPV